MEKQRRYHLLDLLIQEVEKNEKLNEMIKLLKINGVIIKDGKDIIFERNKKSDSVKQFLFFMRCKGIKRVFHDFEEECSTLVILILGNNDLVVYFDGKVYWSKEDMMFILCLDVEYQDENEQAFAIGQLLYRLSSKQKVVAKITDYSRIRGINFWNHYHTVFEEYIASVLNNQIFEEISNLGCDQFPKTCYLGMIHLQLLIEEGETYEN